MENGKENSILMRLLMTNIGYEVQNQNYLLMILEDLAEQKAKTKGTTLEVELASIQERFKKKELESTLVLAQNLIKLMPEELKSDVNAIADLLKSANN